MTERTLFPDDDPDKVLPPNLPHNGTDTSKQAAKLIRDFAGSQQDRVLRFIQNMGERGATDQEIELGTGLPGNSVRPRRTRLVELGKIKDSGRVRNTSAGRPASVWIASAVWSTTGKSNPNRNNG